MGPGLWSPRAGAKKRSLLLKPARQVELKIQNFSWEMQALNSVPAASKAPLCHQPWCLAPLQAAPGCGLGSHQAGVAPVCRDNVGQGRCDGVTHGVQLIWWEH